MDACEYLQDHTVQLFASWVSWPNSRCSASLDDQVFGSFAVFSAVNSSIVYSSVEVFAERNGLRA
jgi:hypothetical protein